MQATLAAHRWRRRGSLLTDSVRRSGSTQVPEVHSGNSENLVCGKDGDWWGCCSSPVQGQEGRGAQSTTSLMVGGVRGTEYGETCIQAQGPRYIYTDYPVSSSLSAGDSPPALNQEQLSYLHSAVLTDGTCLLFTAK